MSHKWNDRRVLNGEKEICNYIKNNKTDKSMFLYIIGLGFDKRMCDGIQAFAEMDVPFTLWKISLDEGKNSPSQHYFEESRKNSERLDLIVKGKATAIENKTITFWRQEAGETRYVAEANASKLVKQSSSVLHQFTDIIIDISAIPQAIYLCMINMLLRCCGDDKRLYVVANENYKIDLRTEPVESEEIAHEMQGFSSTSEDIDNILIWYPVLGEVNPALLKKHHEFLINTFKKVDEICPVVPFPAVDVRRADDILKGYHQILFGDWKIDKKNIIYAPEASPLRVAESLFETSQHYQRVLKPLGDSTFIFSPITSKLMSVGAFLSVFDLKEEGFNVSILGINNKGYKITPDTRENIMSNLTCILISTAHE